MCQHLHTRPQEHHAFAGSLEELGVSAPLDTRAVQDVRLSTTEVTFVVSASVPPPSSGRGTQDPCAAPRAVAGGWAATDRPARLYVTQEGRIVTTWPGGDGRLGYRPAEGTSRFC